MRILLKKTDSECWTFFFCALGRAVIQNVRRAQGGCIYVLKVFFHSINVNAEIKVLSIWDHIFFTL